MPAEHQTERIGVRAVGLVVEQELRWLFREQPTSDYGIAAHLEVVAAALLHVFIPRQAEAAMHRLSSDHHGEFIERHSHPPARRRLDRQSIVTTSKILDKGMPGQ